MENEDLLLTLIYAYTNITLNEANEEARSSDWFKIAEAINKAIYKRKRPKLKQVDSKKLLDSFDKAKDLDTTYFTDIDFSSFICSILLLDLSIREYRHLFSRSKLLHHNIPMLINELETNDRYRPIMKTHHRFITKLIEEI